MNMKSAQNPNIEPLQDALMRAARAVAFVAQAGVEVRSVVVDDPALPRIVLVDGPALRSLPAGVVHGACCGLRSGPEGRTALYRAEVYGCAVEWEGRRRG